MHVCGMCCEHRYDIQLAQLLTEDSGTPMGHNAAFLALGDPAGPVFTEDLPVQRSGLEGRSVPSCVAVSCSLLRDLFISGDCWQLSEALVLGAQTPLWGSYWVGWHCLSCS